MPLRLLKASCLALLVQGISAQAATYYVNPESGSDKYLGGRYFPWKTLSKAQSRVVSGDEVLLASGKTFFEPLVARSGVAYSTYNGTAPAVISGRRQVDVSGTVWTKDSTRPVYMTTLPAGITGVISQVTVGTSRLTRARVPNAGRGDFPIANSQFARVTADGDAQTLNIDPRVVPAGADVDNAIAMIRMRGSDLGEYTVTSWKAGSRSSLDVKAKSFTEDWYIAHEYTIPAGHGYWLENKLWMLDSAGEWFYEPTSRTLHVWMPNGLSPQGQGLHVSVMPHGIVGRDVSNVSISSIQVADTASDGISLINTSGVKLSSVSVVRAGRRGISMTGSRSNSVSSSTVDQSASDGIWLGYVATTYSPTPPATVARSVNVDITGSAITNSGTRGYAQTAVRLGEGGLFASNRVQNTPYVGVFAPLNNRIEKNVVLNSCSRYEDCGGIYVQQPPANPALAGSADGATPVTRTLMSSNITIVGNIVDGGSGSADGLPEGGGTDTRGIYLDDYVNGVKVTGNFVAGMKHGYMLHTAFNNEISDNLAIRNRSHNIFLQEDPTPSADLGSTVNGEMRLNKLYRNAMVASRNAALPTLAIPNILHTAHGGQGNTQQFGQYEQNQYATLNPNASATLAYNYGRDNPVQDMDLATWRGIGNDLYGNYRAYRSDAEAYGFYNSADSGNLSVACPTTVTANCSKFFNLKTGAAVTFPLSLTPKSSVIVIR